LVAPCFWARNSFNDEVDNIAKRHLTHAAPQQSKRLHRIVR
jgi:hypothetical protein